MRKQTKRIKRLSACLALCLAWSGLAYPVNADLGPSMGATPGGKGLAQKNPTFRVVANLAKVSGNVSKSDPLDNKSMSPFVKAINDDRLAEGSYVQTGNNG